MSESRNDTTRSRTGLVGPAIAALALVMFAAPAAAQAGGMDARWQPWLGCWEPVDLQTGAPLMGSPLLCVRLLDGGAAQFTTVGDVESTQRSLIADGRRSAVSEAGCSGWENATFSQDARRVFLRSEFDCAGGMQRRLSAVMAWVTPTEWVEAQAAGLAGQEMVPTLRRFRIVDDARTRAAGFSPLSDDDSRMAGSIRTIASAPLTVADVREAAAQIEPVAIEALLLEHGEGFELDASTFVQLAESGVPDDVIDVMVALSWPDRFRIDRGGLAGDDIQAEDRSEMADDDPYWRRRDPYGRYGSIGFRYCSPFDWGWSMFGYCSPYGYGYGGYLGGYYGGGYYGGYYGRPVIIVRGGDSDDGGGRVVSGRGYTRGRSSTASRPGSGSAGGGATIGSRSGGASGGSMTSSGARSGSSGSSGRTARKRGG
ncbi:MAG: hypothetical protein L0271_24030 [Gemmatimonadetes bacterium]|nr:hypothetical protein [Gemmatimonadota bacterium]